jgi:hypothetical protein
MAKAYKHQRRQSTQRRSDVSKTKASWNRQGARGYLKSKNLKAEVAFSYVVRGQADFAGGGPQPVSRGAAAGRAAEQRDAMSGEKVSTVAKAVEMLEVGRDTLRNRGLISAGRGAEGGLSSVP